jgi:hypothetical protein
MYHIETATPLDEGRIKLRFRDGFEGEVSVRPLIQKAGVFAFLDDVARFRDVRIGEDGRWIYWYDSEGDEVDLCADALRFEAEARAVDALAAAE